MKALRSSIASFVFLLVVCDTPASASPCLQEKVSANLSAYSAVFSGTVVSINSSKVTFDVDQVWKGDLSERLVLRVTLSDDGLSFTKGNSYLVYASGQEEERGSVLIPHCFTKRLVDAKKDIEVLGVGLKPEKPMPPAEIQLEKPAISNRRIVFPPNHKVTIEAQGPAGYTIVLFGYLSPEVSILENLKRVSQRDHRVFVDLANGEKASFVTPDIMSMHNHFELQTSKVQAKPFTSFQDEGEIESGALRSEDGQSTAKPYLELTGLPRGFRVKVSWSVVKTPKQTRDFLKNSIVPCEHVNHLAPGVSTYQDLIYLLGQPDETDEFSDSVKLYYRARGITVHVLHPLDEGLQLSSKIDSILVGKKFEGRTPEGLYIGLPKEAAMRIAEDSLFIENDHGDTAYIARHENEESCFEIQFASGKITSMTVFRP
jgi:hypothetical protein